MSTKLTKVKKVEVQDLLNEGKEVVYRNKFKVVAVGDEKMRKHILNSNQKYITIQKVILLYLKF
jgi:hypothetical protein